MTQLNEDIALVDQAAPIENDQQEDSDRVTYYTKATTARQQSTASITDRPSHTARRKMNLKLSMNR